MLDQHAAIVADFATRVSVCIAVRDSNAFVPLTNPVMAAQFENVVASLFGGDHAEAERRIAELQTHGLGYQLVRYPDPHHDAMITGFLEDARPGTPQYRGWGGVLVRAAGKRRRVYQAPHVRSDAYTLPIAVRAFVEDPHAAAAVVAGCHRYANGASPPVADVTRRDDNLFHVITAYLAHTAQRAGAPLWFVQFHGSHDRPMQPMITGSDGSSTPRVAEQSLLMRIKRRVEERDGLSMGVCGWQDTAEPCLLCGKENIQGLLLERMGLRSTFMHFELEHRLRRAMYHGVEPGYGDVLALLAAIREIDE